MSVPVPSWLYDAIMSALRSGGASPVAAGALTVEDMGSGMVMMPARSAARLYRCIRTGTEASAALSSRATRRCSTCPMVVP